MGVISVLVVDDHPIVRQGLKALLASEPGIEIAGEAEDGQVAVTMADELHPDVILMDIALPKLNGIDATREIVKRNPSARVLVLTTYGHDKFVGQAVDAGAAGFLLKHSAAQDLIKAIKEVRTSGQYFTPAIARRLSVSAGTKPKTPSRPTAPTLTFREAQVLQLISDGFANKQIASELRISIKTVEKHRQRVMNKLGIHETAGLTRYALGLQAGPQ
ncbi:MAG TPA: response regulator transcription factor [Verrucomicrobiae bacterium]|nr:response regulator transcription factor [Verrucomicrobiae bacterium]